MIDDPEMDRSEGLFGRFINFLQDWEWYIIGLMAIIGLACGFVGYGRYFEGNQIDASFLEKVYFTIQLISMEFNYQGGRVPPELEVARFLLPLLTIYTIARAVIEVFRYKISLLRIRLLRNHIIIAGLGEKGTFILEDLSKLGDEVVGIEMDQSKNSVKKGRELGEGVVIGDAASHKTLISAGIRRASTLIVTCDDESTNIEVAKKAIGLRRGEPIRTYVHIKDMRFCPVVEFSKEKRGGSSIRFFNVFENGARQMLKQYPPDVYGGSTSKKDLSIAIIGFGPLGENVLIQALKIGHYPRGRRLRILVIGEEVEKEGRIFLARYPQVERISDIDITFKDVEMDRSGRFDPEPIFEKGETDIIYVCLEEDTLSQSCALNINKNPKGIYSPIVINMIQNTGFASVIQKEKNPFMRKNKLYMYTPIKKACSADMVMDGSIDSIARAFHLHYILMKKKEAVNKGSKFQRNERSLQHWTSLPESLKESNRQAADHIDVKLRSIGCERVIRRKEKTNFKFKKEEIEILGEMEHNRWNAERYLDGWSLGKKDVDNKKSPYLLEWSDPELPEDIKDYDRDLVRSIPDILDLVEPDKFRIRRKKR